jgi:thiol-disulfide isomerase/thioredoxin
VIDKLKKYKSDLLWVAVIAILYFTGGIRWLQGNLAMLIAGSPEISELSEEVNMQWQLRTLEGEFADLADFDDKPVFLSHWATWCGPCVAEMPSIQKLYKDYGDKINFVLVSSENPQKILPFLEKNKYSMPVFRPLGQAPPLLESRSIPATFILNPQGQIVVKHIGAANWNSKSVRETLDAMLN